MPQLSVPWGRVSHGMSGYRHTYGPNSNCSWTGDFSGQPDPLPGIAKVRFWITRMDLGPGDRLQFYKGTSIHDGLADEVVGPILLQGPISSRLVEVRDALLPAQSACFVFALAGKCFPTVVISAFMHSGQHLHWPFLVITTTQVFSDKVLILFQSDNDGPEMGGFDFSWPAPWCPYLQTLDGTSGTFTDGSPQQARLHTNNEMRMDTASKAACLA